jgi:hypothetical protein
MTMGFLNKLKFSFKHFNLIFFKQLTIINDNVIFLIITYFQGALIFKVPIYNVIDNNLGGGGGEGVYIHPMTIFF